MNKILGLVAGLAGLSATAAHAGVVDLGSAASFAVLGGTTVTNTGNTEITGNLGVDPGTAVTGFGPGTINGESVQSSNAAAQQAQDDVTTAYNMAASETGAVVLTGQDLGNLTLTPGVYFFASSAQLTGTLTLNAEGRANAQFIFQIGSTLTTATSSSVDFINGASGNSVFWQVGSSATIGTYTTFEGNILANTSITMTTGSTIGCGSALARNGAVTLDTNTIASCGTSTGVTDSDVPEPSSVALLGGFAALAMAAGTVTARRRTRAG